MRRLQRAGHPSVPPRAVPRGRGGALVCLTLLALAAGRSALADPPDSTHKHKASSFAPHHTASHVYGTPVGKPILHKHKKPPHTSDHSGAAAPLK